MFKKVVSGIVCVAFMAALFSVTAFSSYTDFPLSITYDNLWSWDRYPTSNNFTYSVYIGSGNRTFVQIDGYDQLNPYTYFVNPIRNVIAGQRYILSGKMSYALANTGYFEVASTRQYNSGDNNNLDWIRLYNDTQNSTIVFSYAFTPDWSSGLQSNFNNDSSYISDYDIIFRFNKTSSTTYSRVAVGDLNIICIDDVVMNALRNIEANVEDLPAIAQQISDYLFHMLYDEGQTNNISELVKNQYEFFRFMIEHFPNSIHSDFFKTYGQDFYIALYELLSDALIGDPDEFVTDPAVSDAVSDYNELESSLMVDKSADVSSALNSGMQGIQNNNAFAWIRNTLQVTVFDNTKLSGYILFALSMGLIVLVLGRKIHL